MTTDVVVLVDDPYCAEARLELQEELITPTSRFYARNNFSVSRGWTGLSIGGALDRPHNLGLSDLKSFDDRNLVATLECAGNGRAFIDPSVPGEQWRLGAVSTAVWSGIALRDVLVPAGVHTDGVEILFQGSDGFDRSLPIDVAMAPETMIVLRMNGVALAPEQGGPARLLVPGWYGMSAVKWLVGISAITEPFRGHYQVERYVIDDRPIREMEVRSVITAPQEDATVGPRFTIRGFAWTGRGVISAVEISTDGGRSWLPANIRDPAWPFAWVRWSCQAGAQPGTRVQVVSRATDSAGRTQPLTSVWNALGYCNNASQPVTVIVEG
jgi:DMSO/TMAO reductase YedYZ molybdopterin-dependent catalytic subunit